MFCEGAGHIRSVFFSTWVTQSWTWNGEVVDKSFELSRIMSAAQDEDDPRSAWLLCRSSHWLYTSMLDSSGDCVLALGRTRSSATARWLASEITQLLNTVASLPEELRGSFE